MIIGIEDINLSKIHKKKKNYSNLPKQIKLFNPNSSCNFKERGMKNQIPEMLRMLK